MSAKPNTNIAIPLPALKNENHEQHKENLNGIESLLQSKKILNIFSELNNTTLLLWDCENQKILYLYDSENLLENIEETFAGKQEGHYFSFLNVQHKEKNAVLALTKKGIDSLRILNDELINETTINICCTCKLREGYYKALMKAIPIVTDGNPSRSIFLCSIYNISHIKKQTCDLVINTPKSIEMWSYNFDKQTIELITPLSMQEKTILQLMHKGETSKKAARALFVSSHTIDTHRRNLLKKTNCLNTTALITYAKMIGLLLSFTFYIDDLL